MFAIHVYIQAADDDAWLRAATAWNTGWVNNRLRKIGAGIFSKRRTHGLAAFDLSALFYLRCPLLSLRALRHNERSPAWGGASLKACLLIGQCRQRQEGRAAAIALRLAGLAAP